MTLSRARVSLWRYSPALVVFAIVVADSRQMSDPDLWGHVLFGRELLAHGSLPPNNIYSYSAPAFPWLHHEWLSEVLMSAIFSRFGALGLKLLKFFCTAGTISFVVLAMAETGASVVLQAAILLIVALIMIPEMQFRPQIFDFLFLSATLAMLSRHNWRRSAPLWLVIPMVAVWINLHGGFFVGLVAIGVYGATVLISDFTITRAVGRGLRILAIAAAAAASTLLTFAIPPARESWYTLIYSLSNPMTSTAIVDWRPLIASITFPPSGSLEQKYFILVLVFFIVTAISVVLTPRGDDLPLVAVAAFLIAAAFRAQRNIAIAAIAIAPVLANHLNLLMQRRAAPEAIVRAQPIPRAVFILTELLIFAAAMVFARYSGVLRRGIDASGSPAGAIDFMHARNLDGNILADYAWGTFVIWHGTARTKVFVDSRFDLAYPADVVRDFMNLDNDLPGASHTLVAYPHDFVLVREDSRAALFMDSRTDWRLIYRDGVARLYAPANSPAAHLEGMPVVSHAGPALFP